VCVCVHVYKQQCSTLGWPSARVCVCVCDTCVRACVCVCVYKQQCSTLGWSSARVCVCVCVIHVCVCVCVCVYKQQCSTLGWSSAYFLCSTCSSGVKSPRGPCRLGHCSRSSSCGWVSKLNPKLIPKPSLGHSPCSSLCKSCFWVCLICVCVCVCVCVFEYTVRAVGQVAGYLILKNTLHSAFLYQMH